MSKALEGIFDTLDTLEEINLTLEDAERLLTELNQQERDAWSLFVYSELTECTIHVHFPVFSVSVTEEHLVVQNPDRDGLQDGLQFTKQDISQVTVWSDEGRLCFQFGSRGTWLFRLFFKRA